jgi:hypothetical protein
MTKLWPAALAFDLAPAWRGSPSPISSRRTRLVVQAWHPGGNAAGSSRLASVTSTYVGSPGSTKARGVPRPGRNDRSPLADDAKLPGSPRVQAKRSAGHVPQATTGAPAARWHRRQWQ